MGAVEIEIVRRDALKRRGRRDQLDAGDLLKGEAVSLAGGAHSALISCVRDDARDGGAVRHGQDPLMGGVKDVQHALAQGVRCDKAIVIEEAMFKHPVS